MKRFKVEHKNLIDKPDIIVTLNQPPYENENILAGVKWKQKDVTITEMNTYYQGEE